MSDQTYQFQSPDTLPREKQPFLLAYQAGKGPVVTEAWWDDIDQRWRTRYGIFREGDPDILGWAPMPEWTGLTS